jgi:signal transduction histidine kinase
MSQGAIRAGVARQPSRWLLELGEASWGPLLLAAAYFIGAEVAFLVGTLSDRIFAPFWPPNVILFCALLLVPERRWWVYIAAVFPAHVLAELQVGMPAGQMLVAFVTNCMVAVLNALAVRRLLGERPWFGDLRKTALYILVTAGACPAFVAMGGAFVPILGGGSPQNYELFWTYWFLSNALSSLTVGPLFLAWTSVWPRSSGLAHRRQKLEAVLLGVLLVGVCALAFEASAGTAATGFLPAILYSPLPLILWATVRFGAKGASTAILIVTVVLIWRVLKGPSLFLGADPETNVLALQVFLIALSIPTLLLGAAIDELRHAEEAMRHLAGSVLTAQDEERRRIARELHDSTGQNLIAAGMLVGRVRPLVPEAGFPIVQQLDDVVRQSLGEVRTMSYVLHPPLLDEAGLRLALRHYVEGFTERSGTAVELLVDPDLQRLPGEIELALFRVVQEALTNVRRHAPSKSARVRLARGVAKGVDSIMLSVEDGHAAGASKAAMAALAGPRSRFHLGVGLTSMQERLRQVGGELEIERAPGRTMVTATVPIHDGGSAGPA